MMTSNVAVPEEVLVEDQILRRDVVRDTVKVSWSSIIAGLVVALGAWVLLSVLGLALGLSQADPNDPTTLRSAGMITGIWSVIVPIVALLLGGLVAARTAGIVTRPTGAIHGVVLWSLMMVASIALVGFVVKGVVNTAIGAGTGLANAAGVSATGGAQDLGQALGLDSQELLATTNDRLRSEGRPPVSQRELDATLKDIGGTAMREGGVDHATVVTAVTRNTRLQQADADDLANQIELQVNQQTSQLGQNVRTGAARVADTTGHAMWWVFLGMVLGLGAAVLGSTLGVSRRQRLAATLPPMTEYVTHHRPAHST
jgi:hypothetical protein